MNFPRTTILTLALATSCWVGLTRAADTAASALSTKPATDVFAVEMDHGYVKLGFEQLAGYEFTPPAFDPVANPNVKPPTGEEQIPAAVKAWNGKKAVITGYMVPLKLENGLVTEFLVMRNVMSCCYGVTPNVNEWVVVKMEKGVPPLMDVPVSFYGRLKVGAMFESGYMTGLYELDGERMAEVKEEAPAQVAKGG